MKFLTPLGLLISVVAGLVCAKPDVWANPPSEGGIESFDVGGGKPSVIWVRLDPHTLTRIEFSSPVDRTGAPPWPNLEVYKHPFSVYLRPKTKPTKRRLGTLVVHTWSGPVSVVLLNAEPDEVPTVEASVHIRNHINPIMDKALATISTSFEEIEKKHATLGVKVDDLNTGLDVALEKVNKLNGDMDTMDRLTRLSEEELIRITGNGVNQVRLIPRSFASGTINTRVAQLSRSGSQGVLRIEVTNDGYLPATIGNISVQAPHVGINHIRSVHVDGVRKRPQEQAVITIAPGESARLALVVDDAEALTSAQSIGMAMNVQQGQQPSDPDEIWFVPEIPEPHENEGKRTLYAKGLIGGMWLGDKSVPDELRATLLSGYGARLTYGFTQHINVDSELVYASSGTAQFGEVARSASLLRFQGGVLLRFGTTYMPTMRAGLGLYGASQRRKVGVMAEDPDIEVDLTLTGGVGLDVRISKGWVIGGSLSLDKQLSSDARTLELAVHVGFEWLPAAQGMGGVSSLNR